MWTIISAYYLMPDVKALLFSSFLRSFFFVEILLNAKAIVASDDEIIYMLNTSFVD